jgi:RNA polymerase sigma-70 factor (ECF subfamily)
MSARTTKGQAPSLVLVPRPAEHDGDGGKVSDADLVAALRKGDASVATAFHDRVRPVIDRTLFRLLGRRDVDHDDLAQRSLIELFTTIASYRGECALDSWTATLTARMVWKHLRRRKLERQLFEGITAEDSLHLVASSEAGAQPMLRSLVARIGALLKKIEPEKVAAFLLHDVWGHDLREVATITGSSVAAAQTRLSRGRRELHALIEANPELRDLIERGRGNRG